MHRDIVPRAFTCDYTPVRDFMRTWGPQYYDHGPLKKLSPVSSKVMMYTHVGRMYALQPRADQTYVGDDGYHPLLPPEAGLWIFTAPTTTSRLLARKVLGQRRREVAESGSPEPLLRDPGSLREAFLAFMDTPHPLEILAGPAYGDDGSISRYHNPDHYKKGLGTVYAGRRKALQSRFSYGEPLTPIAGVVQGPFSTLRRVRQGTTLARRVGPPVRFVVVTTCACPYSATIMMSCGTSAPLLLHGAQGEAKRRVPADLSSARKWTASKLRESAGGGDTSEDTAFGCAEAPVVPRTAHVVTNMRGVGRNQPRERSAAGLE